MYKYPLQIEPEFGKLHAHLLSKYSFMEPSNELLHRILSTRFLRSSDIGRAPTAKQRGQAVQMAFIGAVHARRINSFDSGPDFRSYEIGHVINDIPRINQSSNVVTGFGSFPLRARGVYQRGLLKAAARVYGLTQAYNELFI